MSDTVTEKSTPDPQTVTIVAGFLRTFLAGLTGVGVAVPFFTDTQLTVMASLAISTVSFLGWVGVGIWSWWSKRKQARLDHAGNVASARGGVAVKVVAQDGVPPV